MKYEEPKMTVLILENQNIVTISNVGNEVGGDTVPDPFQDN